MTSLPGFLRKLRARTPDVEPPPSERPDPDRIARLEWEQLGVAPADGSRTAEDIALTFAYERLRATCVHENVIETTLLGQAAPHGMCQTCGTDLVMDDGEHWRPA